MVCYITELYGMIRNGMVLLHLVQYGTIFRKVQYRCRVYTTYQLYPHSRWWNPIRSHKNETPMENHHITTIHWWSQPPTNMPMKYPHVQSVIPWNMPNCMRKSPNVSWILVKSHDHRYNHYSLIRIPMKITMKSHHFRCWNPHWSTKPH